MPNVHSAHCAAFSGCPRFPVLGGLPPPRPPAPHRAGYGPPGSPEWRARRVMEAPFGPQHWKPQESH
eukprot:10147296-Alexandrium_andersonii.AAC.1